MIHLDTFLLADAFTGRRRSARRLRTAIESPRYFADIPGLPLYSSPAS